MKISGQNFKIVDTYDSSITVPDCMVVPSNKIGKGNGEAKLYVGSKNKMREFYGGEGFTAKCFVLKNDLISYMNSIRNEYFQPSQTYRGSDKMSELWHQRLGEIAHLPDVIEFTVKDQTQIAGTSGYVNSKDEGYSIIRTLALPLVSYISTMQLKDSNSTPIYYWKLFADFDAIQDKADALVYVYGKGKGNNKHQPIPPDNKKQTQLRKAREGQGQYREKLLEECPFCPITKINDERLLIASHIKPWAVSSDKERLDPKNGFMLSPLYDKLFDKGFITFTTDKRVQISDWLSPQNQKRIGIKTGDFIQMLPLDNERETYLQYHRASVFKG